jgi:hypothetical protein
MAASLKVHKKWEERINRESTVETAKGFLLPITNKILYIQPKKVTGRDNDGAYTLQLKS